MPHKHTPLLLYIHGFNSSPRSEKALEVRQFIEAGQLAVDYDVPALPDYPDESYRQLVELLQSQAGRRVALIGSSMGGFFATVLARQFGLRAALVNPAIRPSELIDSVLGDNLNPYTGHHYVLEPRHTRFLQDLESAPLTGLQNLLLLVQTGDETLDYRRAVDYYRGCKQVVEQGGNHRFQHFDRHLPAIFEFLDLK